MVIASRTPEGDPFVCRVCGAADRVEPSAVTGDAVCPRCGGYLASFVAGFDDLFGGPHPITLDTRLESVAGYDSLVLVDRVQELEASLGVVADFDELARCETVEDVARYLAELRDRRPGS